VVARAHAGTFVFVNAVACHCVLCLLSTAVNDCITQPTYSSLCSVQPGDVLFFDSFVCHRSAPNLTSSSRRLLYSTYAMRSEGSD
jgi:hypothetical protein